jgi:uncharacterized OsmC-like protein
MYAVERAIELSKGKYCSVSAMLANTAVIEHTYESWSMYQPTHTQKLFEK